MATVTKPLALDETLQALISKLDANNQSQYNALQDIKNALANSSGVKITYGTSALTDGTSDLATGTLYFQVS